MFRNNKSEQPQLPSDYRNQIAEELALLSGEATTSPSEALTPPSSSSVPRLVVPEAMSYTGRTDEPVVMSAEMAASLRADAVRIGRDRQLSARQPRPTFPSGGLWGNNNFGLPQPPQQQIESGPPTPYWHPGQQPALMPGPSAGNRQPQGQRRPNPNGQANGQPAPQTALANHESKPGKVKEFLASQASVKRNRIAAGIMVIAAISGFTVRQFSAEDTSITANQAVEKAQHPSVTNANILCGISALSAANVSFDAAATVQVKVNLKEPNHTAYIPADAIMATDLSVNVCGTRNQSNAADTIATYNDGTWTVNRAAVTMQAAAFESQTCPPADKIATTAKKLCLYKLSDKVLVDGKVPPKGTTYTPQPTEKTRLNAVINSKDYGAVVGVKLQHVVLEAIENPKQCSSLQSAVDGIIGKFVEARISQKDQASKKLIFTGIYGPMSPNFAAIGNNPAFIDNKDLNVANLTLSSCTAQPLAPAPTPTNATNGVKP